MFHQLRALFCSRLIYISRWKARVSVDYAGRATLLAYPIAIGFRRKGGSVATNRPLWSIFPGGNSIDDIIRPQGIVIDSKSTLSNRPAYPQQDKFRSRILSGENFSEKRKRRKTIRYIIDRKFREKNYIYFGIGDIVNRNGIFGRIVWKDLERFGRSKSRVAGVCVDSRRKKFQDTRWIVAQCRRMVFSGVGARTCHITEWNLCPMPSGVTSCRWWTAPPRTLGPPSGYERRRTRPEEENPWFSLGPSLAFPPNFLELFLLLEL